MVRSLTQVPAGFCSERMVTAHLKPRALRNLGARAGATIPGMDQGPPKSAIFKPSVASGASATGSPWPEGRLSRRLDETRLAMAEPVQSEWPHVGGAD